MNNELLTKTIAELLSMKFKIPSYQRGYRWEDNQVIALLDDIWDYKVDNNNPNAFYCLQPIVVKEDANKRFELIDGQQRLTTILLILHYLNETEFKQPKIVYDLTFETRVNQSSFLTLINDDKICGDDIDLYHLNKAYRFIEDWFNKKEKDMPSVKGDFYSKLTNKTRVIWYNVNDGTSEIDIFTRLNIGKIPLTNAELIKALFLMKSNFQHDASLKQIQIATEWDIIEKKLQDDSFWYFIYSKQNNYSYDNRIEYVFDLLMEKPNDHEDYHTFHKFNKRFEENKNAEGIPEIDLIWLEIKEFFLRLEEWYNNNELYHLIGFLIENGKVKDICDFLKESKLRNKSDFIIYLKGKIKEKISHEDLSTLDYDKNSDLKKIKMILLLFNIQTILSSHKTEMRFPFNRYKLDKWDIEHINSQTEKTFDFKNSKEWALDILEYFTGLKEYNDDLDKELGKTKAQLQKEKVETIKDEESKNNCKKLFKIIDDDKYDKEYFYDTYNTIRIAFKEDQIIENNSLSNLTLLDATTNRSYGNAMFPIKRRRIIENDKLGLFVPLCTKNVFLGYYSNINIESMYWQEEDAKNYFDAINEVLKEYLS